MSKLSEIVDRIASGETTERDAEFIEEYIKIKAEHYNDLQDKLIQYQRYMIQLVNRLDVWDNLTSIIRKELESVDII